MSLEYHRQAFVSALNHDEIVVMARGLGMWSLLVKFVKLYASRDTLVFVLSPQRDFEKLKSALIMEEVGEDMMPAVITTAVSAAERLRAYERRGVVCITERILLGDLLRGKLLAESVGGVILTRAERVRELSPPAFVLRLLRDRAPRTTFVKAFTEDAESMASGFGTIEKAMNTLQVSRVSLWPRFHVTVGSSLDVETPVDAVELTQPLTPHMRAVHDAVLLILEENLKDLQGRTRLDPSSLSLRNGMLHSFDSTLKRQLDPQWHRLNGETQQLVADLKVLRSMLNVMLTHDCVTFYRYLETVRRHVRTQRFKSMWLLSEHADTLFTRAKARVFEVVGSGERARLNVVLEENPKLNLLREVLQEAGSQWRARKRRRRRGGSGNAAGTGAAEAAAGDDPSPTRSGEAQGASSAGGEDPVRVLVLVRDAVAAATAREYLEVGGATQLKLRLLDLLRHRNAATRDKAAAWRQAQSRASMEKAVSGGEKGRGKGGGKRNGARSAAASAATAAAAMQPTTEDRLLLAHEPVLCDQLMVDAAKAESLGAGAGARKRQRPHAAGSDDAVDLTSDGEATAAGDGAAAASLAPASVTAGEPAGTAAEAAAAVPVDEEDEEERGSTNQGDEEDGDEDDDEDDDDFVPVASTRSQGKAGASSQSQRPASQRSGAGASQPGQRQRQRRRRALRAPWAAAGQGLERGNEEEEVSVVTMDDLTATGGASGVAASHSGGGRGGRGRGRARAGAGGGGERSAAANGEQGDPAAAAAFATTTAPWLAQLRHAVRGTAHEARARTLCQGDDVTSEYPGMDGVRVVVFPILEMDMSVPPLMMLRPHIVVFFDSEPWAVRAVEVYKATFPNRPLRVYTLMYEETVEEERFRAQLDKEQAAFGKLIQERAHASRRGTGPRSRDEQEEMREIERDAQRSQLVAAGQRIGGRLDRQEGTVVVDDRELKSALPFMLYAAQLRVVAVTLTVGDYILSQATCVERKSIPDLYSSFSSGRLFSQASAMCRYYQRPVLLIEFDGSKPFILQAAREIPSEIMPNRITSRLVLLLRHFPSLRLMWSRSPVATADMFAALKKREGEPNLEAALAAGSTSAPDGSAEADPVRERAEDMLRRLPGVTEDNVPRLLGRIHCIADLATMKEAELRPVMGSANARKLRRFLDAADML